MSNSISVKRMKPAEKILLKNFRHEDSEDGSYRVSQMGNGSVIVFQQELGFMMMTYHITRYELKRSVFGRDYLMLVQNIEVDDNEDKAIQLFNYFSRK